MPEDSPIPFGGGLTGYSDEESGDDKEDCENDDGIIPYGGGLTGYSDKSDN